MVVASGGKGSSPPSVPLASHLTAEKLYQVPLGLDQWWVPFSRCPHGCAFRSPVEESSGLPPPAQPFGRLRAGFLWIAVADSAALLSTTFHHSPSLTGWRTHSAPRCTWLSSIRGWRPGGDRFHVPPGPAHAVHDPSTPGIEGMHGAKRSRSRVNLRVLQPLTQGPQGQPSPLQTPHCRPGVQGIFPTSHGQAPDGCPMVHHSIATGFPIPRGCCLALSVTHLSLLRLVRDHAMSRSPLPLPVTGPLAASLGVPSPRGCCVALAAPLSLPRPPLPSLIPCLYPTGPPNPVARAHRILVYPGTVSCSLHGSLLFRPLCSAHWLRSSDRSPMIQSVASATFPMSRLYWPTSVMGRERSASERLWPSRDATTHTPARAWRGGVFCTCAPHAVQPSLILSFRPRHPWYGPSEVCPSPFSDEGPSFICPRHTWLRRVAMCVICALGYAGWAAHVFDLCVCTRTQCLLFFWFFFRCGLSGTPPHVSLLGL